MRCLRLILVPLRELDAFTKPYHSLKLGKFGNLLMGFGLLPPARRTRDCKNWRYLSTCNGCTDGYVGDDSGSDAMCDSAPSIFQAVTPTHEAGEGLF